MSATPEKVATPTEKVQATPTEVCEGNAADSTDTPCSDDSSSSLTERFWGTRAPHPAFHPPAYLTDAAVLKTIEPPAVVKTWEQRLGELDEKQRGVFEEMQALCAAKGWHDPANGIHCDDWQLLRYCFARQFDVKKATKMLEASLEWERKTKPQTVACSGCDKNPAAHYLVFLGWDLQYRPVVCLSYEHSDADLRTDAEAAGQHAVEMMETVKRLMPPGVEQWVVVVNTLSFSLWKDCRPSIGKAVLDVWTHQYPERLGQLIIVDAPSAFYIFWKAIGPFLDERQRNKALFVYSKKSPKMQELFSKLFPPHVDEYLTNFFIPKAVTETEEEPSE